MENVTNIELHEGTVSGGGSTTSVESFKQHKMKIAILQNALTAGSGEAVLICFKGLENVKTFGEESAGYCSTNTIYNLYDGAYLQLTIGKDVNCLGNEYCEESIIPDVVTENPLEDALEWLNEPTN